MATATVVAQEQSDILSAGPQGVEHQPAGSQPALVTAVSPADGDQVLAMLSRCSSWTLYRRFHGVTDGMAYARQLLTAGRGQDSYGAWVGGRCVGLASLHAGDDNSAEIGVLVEDAWQRRGVGSALTAALVSRARERRLTGLRAEVLSDNHFVLPLLARIGPADSSVSWGSHSVRVRLEPPAADVASGRRRRRVSRPCRPVPATSGGNLR
jgi:GNAT superfamily N-acetyltransferase